MTAALLLAAITVLVLLIVAMAVLCGVPKSRDVGTAFPASREARPGEKSTDRNPSAAASRLGTKAKP
jgi:hypothetical protein